MKKYNADVVIVGAGPAGAFLSYLLAREGVRTVLVERHAELDREFRGEHLHDDVAKMLKKYGLFAKIEAEGILPMKKIEFFNGRRRVMSITPDLFGIEHVGIHFPHRHMLSVLVEEADSTGSFELLMKTTVTGLLSENGQITGVKARRAGEELEIGARIVVGADGRFSAVRSYAHIPVEIRKHGYDVLWAKIPTPANWEPTMRMVLVNNTQISLFASTGGYVQIGWQIAEGSFPELSKTSFAPFIEMLIKSAPELEPYVSEHIRNWSDFVCLPVQSCVCETWVKNGLVLIGDAAHTMSPAGGIGVNAAMKDADVLVGVLTGAIRRGDCSEANLKAFEDARREEIGRMQEGQIRQEKSLQKLNSSKVLMHLFYWNMRVLDKMPWKGKLFAKMYTAQKH
ncbi:FAD-dependent monooxygenase [Ferviditalea candida]|uniref:FAD-dependent monooxygenase n=1 Tax=Ferviditalea candida TaxID=3108399 RepID=A0ABU5ZP63_9BACL|nr:FAD-dependent monooxygenase [Paenibacillaceae bacterium T2]